MIVWFAFETASVGLGALPPVPVGFVDAEPPQPLAPPAPVAEIANVEEPTGVVPAVVVMVRVVLVVVPELGLEIVLAGFPAGTGANENVVPRGRPVADITALQVAPLPVNDTVTAYVAGLPAGTGLGVCGPTV